MPTFVTLMNWTDQGIRNVKESPERARQAIALAEQLGARVTAVYWTVGPYDLIAVLEAPDGETATRFLLAQGSQGGVRTTTLRAYSADEFSNIVSSLP